MAFPPGDGDGRVAGDGDISNDETTVLPPVDGDPALVRPYVRATGVEAEMEEPGHEEPESASAPQMWAADVEHTTVLPPVPPAPDASGAPDASDTPNGPEAPRRRVAAAAALPPQPESSGPRRGKMLALAGGAVALVLMGTGAALLTRPSDAPAVQAAAPSTDATSASPSAASASASLSASASPSHSPKPSPKPSKHPSPTASHSPSPSATTKGGAPTGAPTSLGPGSTGPAVVQLQQDLWQIHVDRSLKATGVYDQQTAQDVVNFQACMSVTGDPAGVYGPATQAAMQQALNQNTHC